MENKMEVNDFTDFSKEMVEALPNDILVLASFSLKRIPKYDTEKGKKVLVMMNEEIEKRKLDTAQVCKPLLQDIKNG